MTNFPINFKNPIFGSFSPFSGHFFFFKKSSSVIHNTTWASKCHTEFHKKLTSQSQENFQTEGWKDRQTLIHMNLLATAFGPISFINHIQT